MAHFTSSGNTLANYDYGFHHIHCPLESYTVKETVNIVATYCCGTGDAASRRSGCWADYSYLCADPSSYMPSAEWEAASADNGNTATSCDQIMDYATSPGQALEGDDFSSASTAAESCVGKDSSAITAIHSFAYICCGTGNSIATPTPSTPPLWAAASLRRSAWCPFSPFSWDKGRYVTCPPPYF